MNTRQEGFPAETIEESPYIEDETSWMHRTNEVVETMRTILLDNLSTRLEKLEAGRIIAACCGILVPEGLLHKTSNQLMDEQRKKEIYRSLWDQLFRDREKEALKQQLYALQKKLKKIETGELLLHPKVVKGLKVKEKNLRRALAGKKKREKKIADNLVLASTEESNANIMAAFRKIAGDSQEGEENATSI